jgi:hypothetical protein
MPHITAVDSAGGLGCSELLGHSCLGTCINLEYAVCAVHFRQCGLTDSECKPCEQALIHTAAVFLETCTQSVLAEAHTSQN